MSRRLAARVITGPAAFLVGAMIELFAYAFDSLRARGGRRRHPDTSRRPARDRGP